MFSATAAIAIITWVAGFFIAMSMRRSVEVLCIGLFAGILFLPQFFLDLPGVGLNKVNLLGLTTGACGFLVDRRQRQSLSFSWLDIPAITLPFAAQAASISNGLGAYDGFVAGIQMFMYWSIPWFVGRAIFSNSENAVTLIKWYIIAAVMYVPFCLLEMRLAPILHSTVYGYAPRGGGSLRGESLRFGLWRPSVFMEFGLMLSLFMGMGSLLSMWSALTGKIPKVFGIKTWTISAILAVVTVLSVGSGAILLMAFGILTLLLARVKPLRLKVFLLVVSVIPFLYPVYRMATPGGVQLNVSFSAGDLDSRKKSLQFRLRNEDVFLEHWRKRPLFGWTAQRYFDAGVGVVPDSLWIQTLCKFGFVGWLGLTGLLASPMMVTMWKTKEANPLFSPGAVLSFVSTIFMFDCLVNAMENPVYCVMAGAAVSLLRRPEREEGGIPQRIPAARRAIIRRGLWPVRK